MCSILIWVGHFGFLLQYKKSLKIIIKKYNSAYSIIHDLKKFARKAKMRSSRNSRIYGKEAPLSRKRPYI